MPTKILVADDSVTMRRVLEMTFAGESVEVVTADSGESALNKALTFVPDVVFADASMQGVDGYALAQRIKSHPQLSKAAVIVMASQHTPYDDAKGRSAGVDDHISKPFDTQSVIDRVGQVLARPRAMPPGQEAPRPAAVPPIPTAPARPMAGAPAGARSPLHATRMGIGNPVAIPSVPKPSPAPVAVPNPPAPQPRAAPPIANASVAAPSVAAQVQPAAAPKPAAAAAVQAATQSLSERLNGLGLSREQVEGVLALSREVVEQVVWEVVPDLAEQLIKEEIKRLTSE